LINFQHLQPTLFRKYHIKHMKLQHNCW